MTWKSTTGDGECYLLLQGADSATNGTDTVFFDLSCEEPADTLAPGQGRLYSAPLPHSVMFS